MRDTKKIGLALGSGGARGWAHIGVLQELNKLGLKPFCVAGTSIGSIAGALYATDTLELAEDLALHLNWREVAKLFFEINFLRSGLVSGRNLTKLLRDIIPARSFEELALPLAIVATDLISEREVIFKDGDLLRAIRASISIPGVLTPVDYKSTHLVDGGLKNPLPISVCKSMGAEKVIAVDINLRAAADVVNDALEIDTIAEEVEESGTLERLRESIPKLLPQLQSPVSETFERWFNTKNKPNESLSIIDVITRSFRLGLNELTRNTLEHAPPEILIQPAVGHIMTLEFYQGREAIEAGRAAVREKRDELEALL